MKNHEIIDKFYKEAVQGLNETILEDEFLWYGHVVRLPSHLQVVYTVIVFHQQVFNGGLHQYFFNPYGQFAYMTFNNLKAIKALKAAEILKKAIDAVNDEKLGDGDFRRKIFNRQIESITNFDDKLGDTLNDLDTEYYSLDENLEGLLMSYLQPFLEI